MGDVMRLILGTGSVGTIIVALLAALSLACWAIMLEKLFFLRSAAQETARFLASFQERGISSTTLSVAEGCKGSAEAHIFEYSYNEITELLADKDSPFLLSPDEDWPADVTAIQTPSGEIYNMTALSKVMETYIHGLIPLELNRMESRLSFLATTGSVATLIGLFGTVWGILVTFQSIATQQSASLATVAPGISAALVTTVAGLLTAVPALVGYNFFLRRIRRISVEVDCYVSLFLTRLQTKGLR